MQATQVQTPKKTAERVTRRLAPATADIHPQAMLRIGQIIGKPPTTPGLLNCGRTHFYRLIQEGKFPKPIKLGHMSMWRASDALRAIADLTRNG